MRVYCAGPMRGFDLFNFPAFDEAATYLRTIGHEVCNPADHDREVYGDTIEPGNADELGFDLRAALAYDLDWIARNGDAVAVLDGWEASKGARAEVSLAAALGLPVAPWRSFGTGGPAKADCVTLPDMLYVQSGDTPFSRTARRIATARGDTPFVEASMWDRSITAEPGDPLTDIKRALVEFPEFSLSRDIPPGEVRTKSATGGEKGVKLQRYDLIPALPLQLLAEHYGRGAAKYADNQWRQGYEWSKSFAALQRHAWAFWSGEDIDDETGSPHLAAVAWHAFCLLQFVADHPGHDDRALEWASQ